MITLQEAMIFFANEQNALDFIVPMRWPTGVVSCPDCGESSVAFLKTRKVWNCRGCKRQFSVKVGTGMEDSPIKLDKWLCAFWLIANAKNGISSYEIHRAWRDSENRVIPASSYPARLAKWQSGEDEWHGGGG